jgi:predicted MFS family arabinose efflux permease
MFPFLPAIARGLGVGIEAIALIVTVRSALGLAGPALGSVVDSWGRKVGLTMGLALFSAGLLPIAFWPTYPVLLLGLVVSTVGNIVVDASIYAFIGDRFSYERRGRAIAVVEIGWSSAYLVGIPAAGWLIARQGWNAPFLWLALAGVAMLLLQWRMMPPEPRTDREHGRPWKWIGQVLREPAARVGLAFTLLLLTANQIINIVYGSWMETQHHLRIEELGAASTVLGLAGVVGVLMVAFFSDRLGKVRAIRLGIGANVVALLALPWLGKNLMGALVVLFVLYLSFEFSLTSALSLMTELVPAARATMMAGNVAAMAAGDALGAFVGPHLYGLGGIVASTTGAALISLLALALLILYVRFERPSRVAERNQI